mmetsp:Transcript_113390/g.326010  ORF Transcript_113390/g.326010 Transcript_113390/m.326010 type:complete len:124 (-) Transcript_113390:288-659(-)
MFIKLDVVIVITINFTRIINPNFVHKITNFQLGTRNIVSDNYSIFWLWVTAPSDTLRRVVSSQPSPLGSRLVSLAKVEVYIIIVIKVIVILFFFVRSHHFINSFHFRLDSLSPFFFGFLFNLG